MTPLLAYVIADLVAVALLSLFCARSFIGGDLRIPSHPMTCLLIGLPNIG